VFEVASATVIAALAVALTLLIGALVWLRNTRRSLGRIRAELDGLRQEMQATELKFARQETMLHEREAEVRALREERNALVQASANADQKRAEAEAAVARLEAEIRAASRALEEERQRLTETVAQRDEIKSRLDLLSQEHAALRADTEGRLRNSAERLAELKEMREKMRVEFEQLAQVALRRAGEDFSNAHVARLTELLTPFREHVGRFELELRQVHKSADEERARLHEQIRQLSARSEAISAEAVNLTRALKGDRQKQGAWGEMILERILEDSGLIEGTHYVRQKSRTDDEGARWRPDVIVRMPRGKVLVVDSKVSLTAYEAATSAETDEARARFLKEHGASMRRHIDQLAAKGYGQLEQGSVDYVLMFIPIEGALSDALRNQPDLTSMAVSKGVGLVTPTTLMLALRTIDHIWTVERREQNAEDIARRAGLLHDKLVGFCDDMAKVDRALVTARATFDDAMGKLSRGNGNLIGQADKLKKLGARAQKSFSVDFDPDESEPAAALGVVAAEIEPPPVQ
jgi:DNA recombination protein RmuC